MSNLTSSPQLSDLSFHEGEALLRVAGTYGTLGEAVLEAVQNAIDMNAKRIRVALNKKNRSVTILDDGWGTDEELFGHALRSICHGIKGKDKLGRFGMGLVSPLGKCEVMLFTSTRRGGDGLYREWTFNSEVIRGQAKISGIPWVVRKELRYHAKSPAGWWRTKVKMVNFTTDRMISNVGLVSLSDQILDRYRATMARKNVVVEISITDENGKRHDRFVKANDFQGQPLDEITFKDKDSGNTFFRIFLSPVENGRRRGKILLGVMGDEFRISLNNFLNRGRQYLAEEVMQALRSGIFEGEILCQRVELSPERKSFVGNDAFMGLCVCIEMWFRQVGIKHLEEAQEARREERYQRLGIRSMKVVEGMLLDERFQHLRRAILDKFQKGTIGIGHSNVPPSSVLKTPQKETSLTTGAANPHEQREGGDEGERTRNPPDKSKEHTKHLPTSVQGPRGTHRKVVRSNSLGLQFSYEILPGTSTLWILDEKEGVLRFNIRHSIWERLERGDTPLMRLQELCAIKALTLLTVPDDWRQSVQLTMDELSEGEAYWLEHGDDLASRGPGAASKSRARRKKKSDIDEGDEE
jgi:hypothetical protein